MEEILSKRKKIKNLCCIGAGYVGGPTMTVIADKCPDYIVKVVDINQERINLWNSEDFSKIPIYEPGLNEILKRVRNKNLFFTTEIDSSIAEADIVFISVNTPIKSSGIGAGEASDLKWVESSARTIANAAKGHTIVVEKSTLPVRTAKVLKDILLNVHKNKKEAEKTFSVLSNPEFLAEGTAINDLENPDRVLIGGDNEEAINSLKKIYLEWIKPEKILTTNLWSSELSKLTANAFLAQRISSINSVSAICEKTGANIGEVSKAIGLDNRIGKDFLKSGPGFGGSCFKKDILNLVYLCKQFNLYEVANYWEQTLIINNWQRERIYKKVVEKMFGNLSGKKIAIFGFAFKANTNDTRESAAIKLSFDLMSEGAILSIHDPKVTKEQVDKALIENYEIKDEKNKVRLFGNYEYKQDILDAVSNADAIIILTEWKYYENLNWLEISNLMRSPSWLFDTRGIVDEKLLEGSELKYWRLGVGNI